jgi:hypothetical protein
MTDCNQPATGARTSHYYVEEVTCGVTPTSPAWLPLRFTSGNNQLTKDSIQSSELDGSREVADIRLGSNQTAGDISVELSPTSYDDLLQAALGSTFSTGLGFAGVDIAVDATLKTFTRASGDFVSDGVEVGNLIYFNDLDSGNRGGFIVDTVIAAVVTCSQAEGLTDQVSSATRYDTGDSLSVGTDRTSFSILTVFADADDGAGENHITRGVEITGYNFDVSVNSMVTGSFPTIGLTYAPDVALPAGSTFPSVDKTEPFASVDGRIIEAGALIGFVTSITINLDNAASAQFEVGSNDTSFIEQGRANSTMSLTTFFEDSTLLNKFINETETSIVLVLTNTSGTFSITYPRVIYTTGAPDVAGEGSITQSLDAQALAGIAGESSIIIQKIEIPAT